MKLSLTIEDERTEHSQYGVSSKQVPYTRANVEGAEADSRVIAGILRSLADDINPKPEPANAGPLYSDVFAKGGIIR